MEITNYVVLDLEMTGLAVKLDRIIEIGAVKVQNKEVVATYATLVNPGCPVPSKVTELTGITTEMVSNGKEMDTAMQELLAFIGDLPIVGHNISFDYSFVKQWCTNKKVPLALKSLDTLKIARALLPADQPKKLESLCSYFKIERNNAHRALDDALETQQIFEKMRELAGGKEETIFVPKELQVKVKKQTPATKHQVERLKEYQKRFQIEEELCWETLTRSEASRIQDRYYATYGR